jgi:branched-chain amino acid aminotransferase
MEEIVYLNGSMVPRSEARISVYDHGFLYGYGLFETMRAYSGKIFRLERHLNRLNESAEFIRLGSRLAGIDLAKACRDTLKANNLDDARIRLTVTGGESDSFPWSGSGGSPTVMITARPYTPFPAEKYEQGFRVFLARLRRSRESSLSRVKSTSYLLSVLARMEAAANGLDEAILLNDDGYVAEGGGSNAFFVKSSRLMTPSLESGILPGITRDVVIELADELGIAVTEGTMGTAIIRQCDEAFLTNSMIEIMPLTEARDTAGNTVTIGGGKPGPVTGQLMAAYKERVAGETGSS